MAEVKTPDPVAEVTRRLRELEDRGSRRLAAQLVESVTTDTVRQAEALRRAADSRDATALFRAAHTLQGTAAIIGADSVANMCAQIVRSSRKGSFAQLDVLVRQVASAVSAICEALKERGVPSSTAGAADADPAPVPSTRKRVLVIDDDAGIRRITQILVEQLGHDVESAHDGAEGLDKLFGIDLVLLDVVMPGLDGFDVCRRIRQHPAGADLPVIIVTTFETREHRLLAVEAGANDFIAKPVDETELRVRTTSLLKMKEAQDTVKRYQAHLEEMCEERTASLRKALEQMAHARRVAYEAQLETVERLAMLAEYKDKVTGQHLQRMSEYSAVIARGLNLPADEVELILHASRMHDVGKVAVPESILRKPARLDPQEWSVMREHSAMGSRILENSESELLQAGRVIALHHHERWDGTGYPNGLAGDDIPLWGRICAVADVFDAVTSERPYKPAFPNEEALQLLRDGRGKHFDPRVIDVFFDCLQDILAIQKKYEDRTGE